MKFKGFMKKFGNKISAVAVGACTVVCGAISALAEGETTTSPVDRVVSEAGTQMGNVFNGALSMISTALPYILGLVGAGVIIAVAVKWIKKVRG